MNVKTYDFRKPARLASDLEQRLASWLQASCALAPGQWAKQLPLRLELSFRGLEALRPTEGLSQFAEACVGYRVIIKPGEIQTLLVLPRPFALALVSVALGDSRLVLPADRDMTAVEDAICEYLIQRLLLTLLQETWAGAEPLEISLGQKESHPKWLRVFSGNENLVLATFGVTEESGEQKWHWILPQKALLELIGPTKVSQPVPQPTESQTRLRALVCELPVEIAVILGAAELSLSQLANLRPGDVVVLNQRVSEPLPALVAGEQKYRVWPGRAGSRRAVQIESLTES